MAGAPFREDALRQRPAGPGLSPRLSDHRGPELRDTVTSTLDYLLEDLRDPEGGFYSARDADSEGEEGIFYLWRPEEVEAVLGMEEAALFGRVYDVSAEGNFEGRSILHLPRGLTPWQRRKGLTVEDLSSRLERARGDSEKPGIKGNRRSEMRRSWWPGTASSSGLWPKPSRTLGRADYLDAAGGTPTSFSGPCAWGTGSTGAGKTVGAKSRLSWRTTPGLGNALLTLYETTLEPRWLEEAKHLAEQVLELFWEEEDGLFFDSPVDGEKLVVRPREAMDNATPSGNSLAVELLLRVSGVLRGRRVPEDCRACPCPGAGGASRFPSAFGRFLSAT